MLDKMKTAENIISGSGESVIYRSLTTIITANKDKSQFGLYQVQHGYLGIIYIGQNELKAIKKAASGNATK